MTDSTNAAAVGEELTQEQRDQAAAEKYRAQFKPAGEGSTDANINANDTDASKAAKPERPADVPEKFWDAEKGEVRLTELVKSYTELEKSRSQPAPKAEGEGDGSGEGEGDGEGAPDPLATYAKEISSHREKMTEKLVAGEELTDDDIKPFEKVGFSKDDILAFVEGQKALGQLARMEVFSEIGGEEKYTSMIEWARANYSEDEVAVYDRDINSMDKAVRLAAARGLAARYAMANGTEGRSVTQSGAKGGELMFRSKGELVKAMSDERYKKDAAYRKEVEDKIRASMAAGVDLRV